MKLIEIYRDFMIEGIGTEFTEKHKMSDLYKNLLYSQDLVKIYSRQ
jgi:hypothetical protein